MHRNLVMQDIASVLFARREAGSMPGSRTDGRVIVLAVEGGAMRGVVAGGMVAALEQLGLLNAFDAVYGSSAGAISGAYFLAGQAQFGTTIFYENINNDKFASLKRILSPKPIVSLDFLLDHVCVREKRLDWEAVLSSRIPLRIVASSIERRCAVVLEQPSDGEELRLALKASARIPIVAGGPVVYRGERYFDASVYESVPFRSALRESPTDIVALMTRPKGETRAGPNILEQALVLPRLRAIDANLARDYVDRAGEYKSEVGALLSGASEDGKTRFWPIQPDQSSKKVSSLERDRRALVQGAVDGMTAVYRFMLGGVPQFVEIIKPFGDFSDDQKMY